MGNSFRWLKENGTIIWSTEEAVERYLAIDIVTGKTPKQTHAHCFHWSRIFWIKLEEFTSDPHTF